MFRTSSEPLNVRSVYVLYLGGFGPPSKIFSINVGEFKNGDFNESWESLNTAIESPFSNGLYGRHNTVLNNIVLKVSYDKNINPNISFQWVIM